MTFKIQIRPTNTSINNNQILYKAQEPKAGYTINGHYNPPQTPSTSP